MATEESFITCPQWKQKQCFGHRLPCPANVSWCETEIGEMETPSLGLRYSLTTRLARNIRVNQKYCYYFSHNIFIFWDMLNSGIVIVCVQDSAVSFNFVICFR